MKRNASKLATRLVLLLLIVCTISFVSGCQPSEVSTSPTPSSTESIAPSPSEQTQAEPQALTEFTQDLVVHFIDVGQADSIFIELPNSETMLIDAGNNGDGETVVSYIQNLGYNTIDYLVATHPHEDHIGGMAYVVDTLNIGSIYMPKVQADTQTFEDLMLAIQNKGLSVNTAKVGINIIDIDDLTASILAPNSDSYTDLNNYSAVIKLTYKTNSFLFMGDAEMLSENEIAADVKADVLKVGHHGSEYSTGQSFLEKVSPKYAVISVGADNSYGHPADDTLEKLDDIGAFIFRTDENGTITFSSDGTNISADKTPINPALSFTPSPAITISVQPSSTPKATPKPTPAQTEKKEVIVYITKTGEKYHRDGCQYLSKSKIAISLEDAKAQGYTPCSKCNPPE